MEMASLNIKIITYIALKHWNIHEIWSFFWMMYYLHAFSVNAQYFNWILLFYFEKKIRNFQLIYI